MLDRQARTTEALAQYDLSKAESAWDAENEERMPLDQWSDEASKYGSWADARRVLREDVDKLRPLLASLELVGDPEATALAKRLKIEPLKRTQCDPDKARVLQATVDQALEDFIKAASKDLSGRTGT